MTKTEAITMRQDMGMRPGSTGDRALRHLMAHGRTSHRALALALDQFEDELHGLLGFPIRMGFIRRVEDGAGVFSYEVGDGKELKPATPPVAAREAANGPWPQPSAKPAPPVAQPSAKAAAGHAPLVIPTFTASTFKDARMAAANDHDEAREILDEAADAVGLDLETVHHRSTEAGRVKGRELVSSMLPLLEVRTLDVARYDSGRLLLELDGVVHVLPRELAVRLYAYLDGHHLERA